MTVKVLIVDDSALMRKMLMEILSSDAEIDVVGTAPDPYVARAKIKSLNPDVVTLDIEMPKMDGLTFLSNLMRLRPTPVVMISTLTQKGAKASLEALHIGAVDYVSKPQADLGNNLAAYSAEIIEKVKMAASANVAALGPRSSGPAAVRTLKSVQNGSAAGARPHGRRLIAIGASTGGTEAIAAVLAAMPANSPPVLIAQHIPEMFSRSFSERVNRLSELEVAEACHGETIKPGHAYVAPGNYHLTIRRGGMGYECVLNQNPHVNRHRPSVDVLFESVAKVAGGKAVGVMLTGMGSDGARGLLAMRNAGARTLAQDKATSVVWGMPGSAVEMGAVEKVMALDRIPMEILECLKV